MLTIFQNMLIDVTSITSLVIPSTESIKSTYFALTVGGGVMGFVAPPIGVRGDRRDVKA